MTCSKVCRAHLRRYRISVPVDYRSDPATILEIQLYGNEPALYERTSSGMVITFLPTDCQQHELRLRTRRHREPVPKQLIGSRVSVTMGDLRSIRRSAGRSREARPYTVSGLSP